MRTKIIATLPGALLALAACSGPAPRFHGSQPPPAYVVEPAFIGCDPYFDCPGPYYYYAPRPSRSGPSAPVVVRPPAPVHAPPVAVPPAPPPKPVLRAPAPERRLPPPLPGRPRKLIP